MAYFFSLSLIKPPIITSSDNFLAKNIACVPYLNAPSSEDVRPLCLVPKKSPLPRILKSASDISKPSVVLQTVFKRSKVSGLSLDDRTLVNKINGVTYKLSGMYDTNGGARYTIYVQEK